MAFGRRRCFAKARPVKGAMNDNEKRFAATLAEWKLNGRIKAFEFEGVTLNLAPRTTLTMDFIVQEADDTLVFYEVKGGKKDKKYHIEEDAWLKMKLAAEKFPYLKMLITWDHKTYERQYKEVGAYGE